MIKRRSSKRKRENGRVEEEKNKTINWKL